MPFHCYQEMNFQSSTFVALSLYYSLPEESYFYLIAGPLIETQFIPALFIR